jgi:hypothetical protein
MAGGKYRSRPRFPPIAIGEALLTSEIMRLAEFPAEDHPRSLALALGIAPSLAGVRDESR